MSFAFPLSNVSYSCLLQRHSRPEAALPHRFCRSRMSTARYYPTLSHFSPLHFPSLSSAGETVLAYCAFQLTRWLPECCELKSKQSTCFVIHLLSLDRANFRPKRLQTSLYFPCLFCSSLCRFRRLLPSSSRCCAGVHSCTARRPLPLPSRSPGRLQKFNELLNSQPS
jgi:hypothetical protein